MGEVINDEFRWSAGVGSASWVFFAVLDYPYPRYPDGKGGFERAAYLFITGSIEPVMVVLKCNLSRGIG